MSEIFEHKLSLLMDGEITPFEPRGWLMRCILMQILKAFGLG